LGAIGLYLVNAGNASPTRTSSPRSPVSACSLEAYVTAGFAGGNRNHNRFLRNEKIIARIEELRRERALRMQAARVPIDELLTELRNCGLEQVADFFDRNAAGVLSVRDLQNVRPEVAIAFLKFLHEGLRIPQCGRVLQLIGFARMRRGVDQDARPLFCSELRHSRGL